MSEIQQLTISEPPKSDESIQGYIARLAQMNPVGHVSWISGAADLKFRQVQFQDDEVRRLSALSGASFELLRRQAPSPAREKSRFGRAVFKVLGHDLPFDCLPNQDSRRVCPECLKESPHHRLIWNFRFVQVCTKHRVRLISQCPVCADPKARPLDWRVKDITKCRNDHDVTSAAATAADEYELPGQQYLEDMLFDRLTQIPELLVGLDFDQVLDVFGTFSDFPAAARLHLLGDGHSRFGFFPQEYHLGSKEPDLLMGFRLSLGLAICQLAPEKAEAALITAAADDQIWGSDRFRKVVHSLRSQMMFWEGKGFRLGALLNNLLATKGVGVNW